MKSLYDTKEDHRKNLHELSNKVVDVEKVKACSRAVGCIVFEEDLLKTNINGKEGYCIKNVTLLSQFVNPSENFAKEPVMRSGTAFLALAPNLVLTMGHCIFKKDVKDDKLTSGNIVDDKLIIFDYKIRKNGEFKNFFKQRNVYRILTVLAAHKESSEVGVDWALLLLDRAVVKRTPLKLNFHSKYEGGTKVHMIGHPEGLPVKYTGEASIRLVNDSLEDNTHMFFTNLDAFHGNSGSPVFDTHHEVIGILRLGQPDRPKYGKRTAYIYPRRDENGIFQSAFGEGVLKISSLKFIRKCFKELQETDFYPAISNTLSHSQSHEALPPGLTLERSCVDCPPRKKKKILKPLGFREIQKIEPIKEMGPIEKCAECNTPQTVHTLIITKCHLIIQNKQKVVEQNDYDLPVPFKLKLSDSISVETKALIENIKIHPSINHEDLLQLNLSKSIASLDLSRCALLENKSLEYISNHLKEALVKLDMSGCKFTKEGLSTLLPLSSLIELNLSGCDFEYCLDWIPSSVTTLHLNGCKLDENTIKNLADTIKNLHVSQCGIDDSILDALSKHLPALEGLDVSGNPALTNLSGLNKLNLKELNAIHCAEITEKSWLLVEDEKLKNLEKLGITLRDDKEGANLLSRLSKEKLVSLDLQASKGLEGGVFDCLQKFESLSFLSFRECSDLKIKNLNKYLKGLKNL